ncbi:MAG: hypothetical protein AB1689_20280 [Thermodesulfobacteriota bacterium]
MDYVKAFVAGFVSTLIFHQGLLAVLWLAGGSPRAPYDMTPAPPFGVPAVVSLAFWGGLWGIVIWPLLRSSPPRAYWARALILGAIQPTLVALFVVFPLKGLGVAAGWNMDVITGALILNGAWGLGVGVLMRTMRA